jgi:CheY-like chemotaxis protein
MDNHEKHGVLIVDDNDGVRSSLGLLLQAAGYDVSLACNGFDGLLQLKEKVPAIVLSDLNMPKMSGFEFLSVVRRRFPQVSVIAMSGSFRSGDDAPATLIADAFISKGQYDPRTLLRMVADVLRSSAELARKHARESAPAWIPGNGKDSHGLPYVIITCTNCLRSFPQSATDHEPHAIQETQCVFCCNTVRYIVDFSVQPDAGKAGNANLRNASASGCSYG